MKNIVLSLAAGLLAWGASAEPMCSADASWMPENVALPHGEEWRPQPLGTVKLGGEFGRRLEVTVTNNYLKIDRAKFLDPFVTKTNNLGYVALGKFIDTSVALAKATGRADVKAIKEEIVATVLRHQQADGYLGALRPEKRLWEIWDAHECAYLITGLMTDWEEYGNAAALAGARKAADWVLANWRTKPATWGKTFVNEPMYTIGQCRAMLRLYAATKDRRYLDFVLKERGLLERDTPIVEGRSPMMWGHAYTYLEECLAQQALWRIRPDDRLFRMSRRAFDFMLDRNGAVVTGGVGIGEGWTDSQDGDGDVGETCATVYELFVADSLLRLGAGDAARLGDFMERTVWNALFAAQHPQGRKIRYYTSLLGERTWYEADVFCCPNNYRRLIARLSQLVLYTRRNELLANLYTPLETVCTFGGTAVGVREETDYPSRETVSFVFDPERPVDFAFTLRLPKWCAKPSVSVNGQPADGTPAPGSIFTVRRTWRKGDRVTLTLPMRIRAVAGRARQAGRIAVLRGPLVYAFDPKDEAARRPDKADDVKILRQHPFDIQKAMQVDPKTFSLLDDAKVRPGGTAIEVAASLVWWTVGVDPDYATKVRLTEYADPDATITYFRTPNLKTESEPDELFTDKPTKPKAAKQPISFERGTALFRNVWVKEI